MSYKPKVDKALDDIDQDSTTACGDPAQRSTSRTPSEGFEDVGEREHVAPAVTFISTMVTSQGREAFYNTSQERCDSHGGAPADDSLRIKENIISEAQTAEAGAEHCTRNTLQLEQTHLVSGVKGSARNEAENTSSTERSNPGVTQSSPPSTQDDQSQMEVTKLYPLWCVAHQTLWLHEIPRLTVLSTIVHGL